MTMKIFQRNRNAMKTFQAVCEHAYLIQPLSLTSSNAYREPTPEFIKFHVGIE